MSRPNRITPEGWLLGKELARLCDVEAAKQGKDGRCGTCAFRAGDHLANGSPETLMTAMKAAAERTPFWCHERDQPCSGWLLVRSPTDEIREMPWEHVEEAEAPPVNDWTICPECSGFGSFEIESPSRPGMYGIASMECFECGGAGGWPSDELVEVALEEREAA